MPDYEVQPFSKERRNMAILLSETEKKHIIYALLKIDVTEGRKKIREYQNNGRDISFTAWLIKCFATVMEDHKRFNALRHGKRKILLFNDVDVAIPVEREIEDEYRTMGYILRDANRKNIDALTREIRDCQQKQMEQSEQLLVRKGLMERFAVAAPGFIKKLLLYLGSRNARLRKKYMGTTGVSAVGMMGRFQGWFLIMGGHFTTQLGVGGIVEESVYTSQDTVEKREYLHLTISVDHDIIDGAPLARFSTRLTELLENTYWL
ncbi:MAG: 2-oxo acid dehydrogenase subunit E2 [Thermoplasmatota archaeon]